MPLVWVENLQNVDLVGLAPLLGLLLSLFRDDVLGLEMLLGL